MGDLIFRSSQGSGNEMNKEWQAGKLSFPCHPRHAWCVGQAPPVLGQGPVSLKNEGFWLFGLGCPYTKAYTALGSSSLVCGFLLRNA